MKYFERKVVNIFFYLKFVYGAVGLVCSLWLWYFLIILTFW